MNLVQHAATDYDARAKFVATRRNPHACLRPGTNVVLTDASGDVRHRRVFLAVESTVLGEGRAIERL